MSFSQIQLIGVTLVEEQHNFRDLYHCMKGGGNMGA